MTWYFYVTRVCVLWRGHCGIVHQSFVLHKLNYPSVSLSSSENNLKAVLLTECLHGLKCPSRNLQHSRSQLLEHPLSARPRSGFTCSGLQKDSLPEGRLYAGVVFNTTGRCVCLFTRYMEEKYCSLIIINFHKISWMFVAYLRSTKSLSL